MTDKELMQQALDALEHLQTDIEWQYKSPTRAMLRKVEKALRARLSQCERCGENNPAEIHTCTPLDPLLDLLRVPENKREWVGLTSGERKILWQAASNPTKFGEMLEAKLKEKNS